MPLMRKESIFYREALPPLPREAPTRGAGGNAQAVHKMWKHAPMMLFHS